MVHKMGRAFYVIVTLTQLYVLLMLEGIGFVKASSNSYPIITEAVVTMNVRRSKGEQFSLDIRAKAMWSLEQWC